MSDCKDYRHEDMNRTAEGCPSCCPPSRIAQLEALVRDYRRDHTGAKDGDVMYSDCVGKDCCSLCRRADELLKGKP